MLAQAASSASGVLAPVGAIFAVIGLVFFAIGALLTRSERRWRRRAEHARGEIVALSLRGPVSHGRRRPFAMSSVTVSGARFPTVTFTTVEGREVRATSSFASSPAPGRVGEIVPVIYDPVNPERFRIDNRRGRGGCGLALFMVLGALFIAIGVALLLLA